VTMAADEPPNLWQVTRTTRAAPSLDHAELSILPLADLLAPLDRQLPLAALVPIRVIKIDRFVQAFTLLVVSKMKPISILKPDREPGSDKPPVTHVNR
jgi:hypothetical protein